jgi:hypothetical protein
MALSKDDRKKIKEDIKKGIEKAKKEEAKGKYRERVEASETRADRADAALVKGTKNFLRKPSDFFIFLLKVIAWPFKILWRFVTEYSKTFFLIFILLVIFFVFTSGLFTAVIWPGFQNKILPGISRAGSSLVSIAKDPLSAAADQRWRDPTVEEKRPSKGVTFEGIEIGGPYLLGQDISISGSLKIDPLGTTGETDITLVCMIDGQDNRPVFGKVTVLGRSGARIVGAAVAGSSDDNKLTKQENECKKYDYDEADKYAVIPISPDPRGREIYRSFRCDFPAFNEIPSSEVLGNKIISSDVKPTIARQVKLFAVYKGFKTRTHYEVYALHEGSQDLVDDNDFRLLKILDDVDDNPNGVCPEGGGCGLASLSVFSREKQPFWQSDAANEGSYQYRMIMSLNIPLESKGKIRKLRNIEIQRHPYMEILEGGAFDGKNYITESDNAVKDFNSRICEQSTFFSHYDFDALVEIVDAPVIDFDNNQVQIPHKTMVVEAEYDWEASYSTSVFIKNQKPGAD